MPKKPNFNYERRQKDLAKKKKRQEKLEAKRARKEEEERQSRPGHLPELSVGPGSLSLSWQL